MELVEKASGSVQLRRSVRNGEGAKTVPSDANVGIFHELTGHRIQPPVGAIGR